MKKLLLFVLVVLTQCAWSSGWQSDQNVNNIQVGGHVYTYQTSSPSVSSCGTNPNVASMSSDFIGAVRVGSGATTACTITFSNAYTNAPDCVVVDRNNVHYFKVTSDTATFTFTADSAMGTDNVAWNCAGNQ